MMHSLFQIALLLVPAVWRASVERDLLDEAEQFEQDSSWLLREAFVAGARLRWEFWTDGLRIDLRSAVRSLRGGKAFACGALCIFSGVFFLDIAAFACIDRVLFRPLPYAHSDELYAIGGRQNALFYDPVPLGLLRDIERAGLASVVLSGSTVTLQTTAHADDALTFCLVTPNALSVLGVRPVIGRDFTPADVERPNRVVLLSDAAWRRVFHASTDIVGKTINLDMAAVEVAGVLPADFVAPYDTALNDVGLALFRPSTALGTDKSLFSGAFIRVSTRASRTETERGIQRLAAASPVFDPSASGPIQLIPMRALLTWRYASSLWSTVGAMGLLWVVSCGHLRRLFLLRFRQRVHSASFQHTLGADRTRLIWPWVIEVTVLAAAGAVAALLIWSGAFAAVTARLPPVFSTLASAAWHPRVVLFACFLVLLTVPVVAGGIIRQSFQRGPAARDRTLGLHRWGVLTLQAATGIVLITCAIAAVRSLSHARAEDLGFDPQGLRQIRVSFPALKDKAAAAALQRSTIDAVRGMPSVEGASLSDGAPLSSISSMNIRNTRPPSGMRVSIDARYFEVSRIVALAGRTISDGDLASNAPVTVLSANAVELLLPGTPIAQAPGRVVQADADIPRMVVGVVADARQRISARRLPTLYAPVSTDGIDSRILFITVRTHPGMSFSFRELRARLASRVTPPDGLSLVDHATVADEARQDYRFRAVLLGACGAIASLLFGCGLYALAAFDARRRQYEFAVRTALGAAPAAIRRMMLRQTLLPLATGIPLGIAAVWWLAPLMQPLLFRTDARNRAALAVSCFALLAAALTAALGPARRASRVDIVGVLKQQ